MERFLQPQVLAFFGFGAVSVFLAVWILRRQLRGPGSRVVAVLLLDGSLWLIASGIELGVTDIGNKIFWDSLQWTAVAILPTAWLIYALRFTGLEQWLSRRNLALLGAVLLISILLIYTNPIHEWMWHGSLRVDGPFIKYEKTYGVGHWVFIAYGYSLVLGGAALVFLMLKRSGGLYRRQATVVLVAAVVPVMGSLLIALKVPFTTRLEISSLSFTVTTWFMAWSLLRFRLADILQVARGRLIESMSDPLVVLDGDGQVVYVNTAAQQLIGHTPLEAVGLPVEEIWAEWPGWMENVETGIETTREVALGLGDEKTFYDMRVSPLLDWRKRLVGMVVVLRDISDRMRAEEELRHYATELEHSNQELEQFAYVASHDLQEPLRMVAGYTQLLSRRYQGKLDADADEFIAFAVDGATRMQRLINDLLEFSRVGTRGKPPEVTDCEVVFERAVLNLKLAIEERHARVTHDPLPTLMADGSQLIQLLQNLIGNAVKFHGGRLPEVHIGASRENGAWLFRVRDNGIGIDPKYFERIFLIFQRLHNRTDYAGTGIGLAVCRKIVERHGGSIWVESEPGKGATFFFTIPIDGENET